MPTVTVKKQGGGDAGTIDLSPAVFEAAKNAVLVREVYNAHMANRRQGTHATKTRSTVRGGGSKPWRQKGTGRARAGSSRSPIWVGGATTFGPQPRSYREKTNKKKRRAAFRAVLTAKLENGELRVVDGFEFSEKPRTREAVEMLKAIDAQGKTLIVTKEKDEALVRATNNLRSSKETPARADIENAISIYDLLACDTLVLTKEALTSLQERLA